MVEVSGWLLLGSALALTLYVEARERTLRRAYGIDSCLREA
jgi:hypothetical protein